MTNIFKHLHVVNTHRRYVRKFCFAMGLYYQGLTHDLSKYSPVEFIPSVKYFVGNRSPIDKEKQEKGYSNCWLHHMHHNKHHWQYWTDFSKGQIVIYDPPIHIIKEMVADRIAACMTYQKSNYKPDSALNFLLNSAERVNIPEKTFKYLQYYLTIVSQYDDVYQALKIIKNDKTVF